MAKDDFSDLKSQIRGMRDTELRKAAGTQTLAGKQVEIHRIGPRAPASAILGLVEAQLARVPDVVIANADSTDDVVIYDRGPNDAVVIVVKN